MAVRFKPRRTTTAAKVPTTSDLVDGELGVNVPDGKIYIRSGGAVHLIGDTSTDKFTNTEATNLGLRYGGAAFTATDMTTHRGSDGPRFGRIINTTSNAPFTWGSFAQMPYDNGQGIFLAANSLADEIFFSRTGSTWVEMLHRNNLPSTAITYSASQTFNSGISFGSGVAASATDLSRHIALWGSLYGISVTGNRLNLVAPTGASVYFVVNGVDVGRAGADGIHDTSGNVRKLKFVTSNANTNLAATHLNGAVEKSNNTAYNYTIPSGLGTQGDAITVVNSGTAGNVTIVRGSGVALYRNGTNANITVPPGSMVTIYRSATANRWIA